MSLQEGYWELTTDLGDFINVDVDVFANVFLKSKGISSLGENFSEPVSVSVSVPFLIILTNFNIFLGQDWGYTVETEIFTSFG